MVIPDHIDSEQSQEDYVHIIRSLCGDNILVPGNVIIAGRMSVEMKIGDLKLNTTVAQYMGTPDSGREILGMLRVVRGITVRLPLIGDGPAGQATQVEDALEQLQKCTRQMDREMKKLRTDLKLDAEVLSDTRKKVDSLRTGLTSLSQNVTSHDDQIRSQTFYVQYLSARLVALEADVKMGADRVQNLRGDVEGLGRGLEGMSDANRAVAQTIVVATSSINTRLDETQCEMNRFGKENLELRLLLQAKDQEHVEDMENLQYKIRLLKEENDKRSKGSGLLKSIAAFGLAVVVAIMMIDLLPGEFSASMCTTLVRLLV